MSNSVWSNKEVGRRERCQCTFEGVPAAVVEIEGVERGPGRRMVVDGLDEGDQVGRAKKVQPPIVVVVGHGAEGFGAKCNPRVELPWLRGIER